MPSADSKGLATKHASTIAAWGGEETPLAFGAAQVPIVQSAPFAYADVDGWLAAAQGRSEGHIYSRNTNPTVGVFEEKVRLLEGAEDATAFASGMAAISNTLFTFLRPGNRIVSTTDTYGGTSKIFLDFLPPMGIVVDLVDTEDADALEQSIRKGARIVYLETPSNPTLKLVDLRRAIAAAKAIGAISVVDNTFATPINQHPIQLGADLVLHSATKFLGGHDDAMGGVLAGRRELVRQVYHYREITGASLGAFAAYLLLRGLKTLDLRVRRQSETALAMARHLLAHPKVDAVFYPGLESHAGHAIAASQMSGFGGVLSFAIKGDFEAVKRCLNATKLAHRAASLGSVNTLIGIPGTTSHVECTPEERARLGIPETLVRYSCGIEAFEDLRDDLDMALQHV
ncbi:aminotransferase class I/II-fold pyridoxal phosphate-dependent enzyme [Sandaracinobacter neustonicus]|uniref:Aminotransferase class I/II-fold pyridoxal phosphate-dependent enzyme n=1 Tax=Sandaracinobacter neustonicus TaxID=1715348 RepID=A0A501XG48_9SPHN|nr:aminotransferase class I/II-fold pyridoxal phosphate-dependent enzyme [Sandaracinobacter neustonicus]TPE59516.1 aminotransferase class I/II-fold pyridoxal phosphate-dependent enzyme [Sandaracinobacter neustonicus]